MTTAPELPVTLPDQPAPAPVARPPLRVVPPTTEPVLDFDDALRRAGPRLQRYAVRRLHDPHEAEEAVQEALLRAFQHREKLTTEDDLMAWLTVVTGRLVVDRLRLRNRATPVAELPPGGRAGRDTADVVVARDEARIALDALEAMPSRQASVLWAREVEGLSYDEIGARFGLSEPSVRSVLHRARKTLRREYALRGGSLPAVGLAVLAPWLPGLRAAGRVRSVVKRAATAAAATATGLAAITVVPFVLPDRQSPATPAMRPALGVHAIAQSHASRPAAAHTLATSVASTPPTAPRAHQTSTTIPLVPAVCRGSTAVGCHTHKAHTFYVHLPVPVDGKQWVGVSTDAVDCNTVPGTPVTQCDTSGGTR